MPTFLRGKFVKLWSNKLVVWENARDTLISIDDIKRIKACTIHIHNPVERKDTGTRVSFVITAINRLQDNDDDTTLYELTDPVDVIAKVIGRDENELAAMLLELDLK